jgi:hypothetical protein
LAVQNSKSRLVRADWVWAAVLVGVAAALRLYRLDLAEFKLDEATHYQLASSLMSGSWSSVGSTSSFGVVKPPLFVYALWLPMQLSRDPRVLSGFLGVLGALAVGGFYLILRRLLSRRAAFAGALLFSVNTQAILHARKLFTADLIPPLCTLLLGAAVAFLTCNSEKLVRYAALTAFALSLLLLVTFSPVLLLPAVSVAFLLRRRLLKAHDVGWAAAAFAFPLAPYVISVLRQGVPSLAGGDAGSGIRPPVMSWIWNLLFGSPWPAADRVVAVAAALVVALLAVMGVVWIARAVRRAESRAVALFIASWVVLAVLAVAVIPVRVEMHYLVVLYPVLFVFPAVGVEVLNQKSERLGLLVVMAVIAVAVWQTEVWVSMLKDVEVGVASYGTPVGNWWKAAERARELASVHEADEVLLLLPGDDPWDEKAHILDVLLSDTPHRVVDGLATVVFPSHTAVLLVASEAVAAKEPVEACTVLLGEPLVASPFGGTYEYRLWLPGELDVTACLAQLQPVAAKWDTGVDLLGYTVERSPEAAMALQVKVLWKTEQGPMNADIHWFNHLLDRQGNKVAQHDHAGWPSARWAAGDRVLSQFRLDLAVDSGWGPFTLAIGQYEYPTMITIPVTLAGEQSTGGSVQVTISGSAVQVE